MNDFGSRSEFQSSGIFCNFFGPQLESNNEYGASTTITDSAVIY